jgi:ATP-dependent Clp protease ATP-binding subunit ClpB
MQIELESLKKETGKASLERREKIQNELNKKKAEAVQLNEEWRKERDELQKVQELKGRLEAARKELEQCQRSGNLARAGELRFGIIPDLEKQLPEEKPEEDIIAEERLVHDAVTSNDIAQVISKATGIPVTSMVKGERDRLLGLEKELEKSVIGQPEAIQAVSNAVRLGRAGLHSPKRPLASFLFLGPTGVGKTELCKQLAKILFDSETAVTRIDMSEYMEKHSVARLIGAPPGYVGYDEGGQLTNAVKRKPYSVVLLDEFEKAHREVSSLLLQVLDEGFLTDSQGVKVDFRNTLIIMTSNIGAELLVQDTDSNGQISRETRNAVLSALKHHFAPEFLNRIDETVIFNRLSRENLRNIVDIRLKEIEARLLEHKIILEVTDEAKSLLAQKGYDPAYGARPLQRVIQRDILNPLAKGMIEGTIKNSSVVKVSATNDAITVSQI